MLIVEARQPDATDAATVEPSGGEVIVEIRARAGPVFGMDGFQLVASHESVRRKGLVCDLINDVRCGDFATDGCTFAVRKGDRLAHVGCRLQPFRLRPP